MNVVRAKKRLGQNFLIDRNVASRIVQIVQPRHKDVIFEIGPGTGALTRDLVKDAGQVTAIEIDRELAKALRSEINAPNFILVEANALALDWPELINNSVERWRRVYGLTDSPRLRVVANLPYYLSSPIIRRLVALKIIDELTLMLQEEVVDRMASKPGSSEYGFLSVFVQFYCEVAKLFRVGPSAFKPAPKVWSAIVRLCKRNDVAVKVDSEEGFLALVRVAFAQRRKTLLNNLRAAWSGHFSEQMLADALQRCEIDPKRRAETLTLKEFADLHQALSIKAGITGFVDE